MGRSKEIEILSKLNKGRGKRITSGLSDEVIERFLALDPNLAEAIECAYEKQQELLEEFPEFASLGEAELVQKVQSGILNFYPPDSVSPYVPIAAQGPWIITFHGAVIYETGGYGMLGLGHNPKAVIKHMANNQIMANVMTASFSQRRIIKKLKESIGRTRVGMCPYHKFVFMNSGSEANTVAMRLTDVNSKNMTDPGGRHAGKKIMLLGLVKAFHGRTGRPAQVSDSSIGKYQVLATFRDRKNLLTVEPNNIEQLEEAFKRAESENMFIEAMFLEPVMGEGNPGQAITPEFYARARELTKEHGSLLVVDSIQAGIRARGVLSIIDYPGFAELEPPDMEAFSKALNGGMYPMSTLGLTGEAAKLYQLGIYGNTMTTNPRALDVAYAVLNELDDDLRRNIVDRGMEFVEKLKALKDEMGGVITKVRGTGLLFSAELDLSVPVTGYGGVEEIMRRNGINVIHGGKNALRFTPRFRVTSEEVDMIVEATRDAILAYEGGGVTSREVDTKKGSEFLASLKSLFSFLF